MQQFTHISTTAQASNLYPIGMTCIFEGSMNLVDNCLESPKQR